jgi:hypothetical protein
MVDGNVLRVLDTPEQVQILASTSNFEMAENPLEQTKLQAFFQPKVGQLEASYALVGD